MWKIFCLQIPLDYYLNLHKKLDDFEQSLQLKSIWSALLHTYYICLRLKFGLVVY